MRDDNEAKNDSTNSEGLTENLTENLTDNLTTQQTRRNRKQRVIRYLILVMGVLIIAVVFLVYYIKSNIDDMIIPHNIVVDSESEINREVDAAPIPDEEDPDLYFLIMGLDYRGEHNALLTDSLMILHIIPQIETVKLLSIPRDLLVENTSGHSVKINALFSEGYTLYKKKAEQDPSILTGDTIQLGTKTLDKAVLSGAIANTRGKLEELLDIDIDNTVLVNFNTVVSLVDEVGGIEIDVKRSMKYRPTNLYLEPGLQVLMGEDALGYARFREDDRGSRYFASDFERGEQQQEVVKALAEQIFSWQNSGKVLTLLKIVSENIQTDMDYSTMYSMITKYYNVFNSHSFLSVPFPEHYSQDGDVVIPEDALSNLQRAFKSVEIEQSVE